MQKYWHKGAFFQSEDHEGEDVLGDIMHRSYDGPTGEDRVDKEMLPKIMQAGGQPSLCRGQGISVGREGTLHMLMQAGSDRREVGSLVSIPVSTTHLDLIPLPSHSMLLQVRNFGRRGRVKHTHLLAEDTTMLADPNTALPLVDTRQRAGPSADAFSKPKQLRT